MSRPPRSFFVRDVLEVVPDLIGVFICRKFDDGSVRRFQILEAEAYRGEEDRACHASKGRTARTEAMYSEGGHVYMFLIYGMYWMLNIVTGKKNSPQAALIRGVAGASGPGRCGKLLALDKSFYGEDLMTSPRIWLEDTGARLPYATTPRVGIKYAGKPWVDRLWRFVHDERAAERDPTDPED
jgi:DNA-3-methyladenine glycosylase